MLAGGPILNWKARNKMKYDFAIFFMEGFLYFEITKAKILPFCLSMYWEYCDRILLEIFDLDMY